jgi:hypothetical protein
VEVRAEFPAIAVGESANVERQTAQVARGEEPAPDAQRYAG